MLRGPRVKRVRVPLAKLPRAAHGFRIAVVSDVHLGPILGSAHTRRVVDAVNGTQPDLIAVVGDLVDGSVPDLGRAAEPLRDLRARHGSFFVTGNHEYFSGAEQWVEHVRELGMQPLENARRALPYFDLAGVNDVAGESEGHGPDFRAALGDRDRSRTAVLLAHQPIVIHDAVRHGVDLQLSGHTHGGQLWPGNHLAELANPTVAGLERYGDTQLYVSAARRLGAACSRRRAVRHHRGRNRLISGLTRHNRSSRGRISMIECPIVGYRVRISGCRGCGQSARR